MLDAGCWILDAPMLDARLDIGSLDIGYLIYNEKETRYTIRPHCFYHHGDMDDDRTFSWLQYY
jgi:hypothetical protein